MCDGLLMLGDGNRVVVVLLLERLYLRLVHVRVGLERLELLLCVLSLGHHSTLAHLFRALQLGYQSLQRDGIISRVLQDLKILGLSLIKKK